MAPPESRQIAERLAEQVGAGADAGCVADHVASVWQQVEEALTPIIGPRGVAALYKRSLHVVAPRHPWLATLQDVEEDRVDAGALRSALAVQDPAKAAAGGGALLQAFHDLLASLVGPSLTGRLLAAAWAPPTSGPSAQGTSQ